MVTRRVAHVLLTLLIGSVVNLVWCVVGNLYLLFVLGLAVGFSETTAEYKRSVSSFALIYTFASFMLVNVLCVLLHLVRRPWRANRCT